MPDNSPIAQPFAYVTVVEADDAVRDLIPQRVSASNCAVDVVRDEDEAVEKARQHRPQLIIVKQHVALYVDELHPPPESVASRICRRARLSRAVRLVTHSDVALTLDWYEPIVPNARRDSSIRIVSHPDQYIIARPVFEAQHWRKEWYSYCVRNAALSFLSTHLRRWLGTQRPAPSLSVVCTGDTPLGYICGTL
jgi:hypothetical protein